VNLGEGGNGRYIQVDEEGVGLVQKMRGFQQLQEAAIHVIRMLAEMECGDGYNYIEDGCDAERQPRYHSTMEGIGNDVHHFECSNDKDSTSGESIRRFESVGSVTLLRVGNCGCSREDISAALRCRRMETI
jgi:hypothetical protein